MKTLKDEKYLKYLLFIPLSAVLIVSGFDYKNDHTTFYYAMLGLGIIMAVLLWKYRKV